MKKLTGWFLFSVNFKKVVCVLVLVYFVKWLDVRAERSSEIKWT